MSNETRQAHLRLYLNILRFQKLFPGYTFGDIDDFCIDQGWHLVKYNNSRKFKQALDVSEDGFSFINPKTGTPTIFYNEDRPSTRQRFTKSHEVGHIFLKHHQAENTTEYLKYGGGTPLNIEWEADIFAQNILIPVPFAKRYFHRSSPEIARYLGLSVDMVNVRKAKLKQDLYWFDQLKKARYRP